MGVRERPLEGLVVSNGFWVDRRVLVTGHTGFKGAWLSLWLQHLGANVTGLSLPPAHEAGVFAALAPWANLDSRLLDIRERPAVEEAVATTNPEVVFHLAAQPLVRAGHLQPVETYETNVMGTVHLLAALESAPSVKAVVLVTTDKVYSGDGSTAFSEDDRLGGHDAYSGSKACVEVLAEAWRWSRQAPAVATARAGNVIGGGDVAPDRLLPDARRAILDNAVLRLRYPDAVRPWQFVLEPLHGYLRLAEQLVEDPATAPSAVNFGPADDACVSVSEVIERVFRHAGTGKWEPEPELQPDEAPILRLDNKLAEEALGWCPRLSLDEAIEWTLEWWRAETDGASLKALASGQIERYEDLLDGD